MVNPGHCLCGTLSWEFTGEPTQAVNCHCTMCRKAHGAPYATYWFLNTDQFSWTCDQATLKTYTSSNSLLERNFCSCCGSVVPYITRSGEQMVTPGGCPGCGPGCWAYRPPTFDS